MQFDLRPHYAFAYYAKSMEFESKELLYYSRKENALHYKFKASRFDIEYRKLKDMECSVPIPDKEAKALETVFGLMVDAMKAYKGEPWYVCDGCCCTVICGKRRVHFESPCMEPFEDFYHMANSLLRIMEKWNQKQFEETMKMVPEVSKKLIAHTVSARRLR